MNIAIVGAAGSCGRQLVAQILDRRLLDTSARLQLVGHHGGRSADELWGLRSDLEDAFVDDSPIIEVVVEPSGIHADLVVMLAGATISTDPNAPVDRAALGHANLQIFMQYADALAARPGPPPMVIVQSNPVELGVRVFADRLGRQRVLGAGAWSDNLRLRAEIAAALGIRRPQVHALMLGQHGDHAVADIVAAVVSGAQKMLPAQVVLEGEWLDLRGVVAAPVILSLDGWEYVYPLELAADEVTAMKRAVDVIAEANAAIV